MSGPSFRKALSNLVRAVGDVDRIEQDFEAGRSVPTYATTAAWKRLRKRTAAAREVLVRPKVSRPA